MRLLILCVLTASMTLAQETRETRTNPSPNPADDAKANSASVPDVYAITGRNTWTFSHFNRLFSDAEQVFTGKTYEALLQRLESRMPLAAYAGIKATFCLIGVNVQEYPQYVQEIVKDGHTLCNHTWKHDESLGKKSADVIRAWRTSR